MRPRTAIMFSAITVQRNLSNTCGHTTRLAIPVSSSRVMNMPPLALPGRGSAEPGRNADVMGARLSYAVPVLAGASPVIATLFGEVFVLSGSFLREIVSNTTAKPAHPPRRNPRMIITMPWSLSRNCLERVPDETKHEVAQRIAPSAVGRAIWKNH
jgi:hypothetical protein